LIGEAAISTAAPAAKDEPIGSYRG
jgi:hypothetical protein